MNLKLALLPGLDGTGSLFQPLIDVLPASVQTQTISYSLDRLETIPSLARQVAQRLRDPSGTLLIAESFSTLVVLELLLEQHLHPAGVVVCAGFSAPPKRLMLNMFCRLPPALLFRRPPSAIALRLFCLGMDSDPKVLELTRNTIATVPPLVLADRLRQVSKAHYTQTNKISAPCLYLRPTCDKLVPRSAAQEFGRFFSKYTIQDIEGPHFLLQTRPTEAAIVIQEFSRALAWKQFKR